MTPRLLLDEMYPPTPADLLCAHGHDAVAVVAMPDLAGSPDDAVLETAAASSRCLVTENVRDFAVLTQRISHSGLLFVNGRRWPRTPGGIKRLADAISAMISHNQFPAAGETRWLT